MSLKPPVSRYTRFFLLIMLLVPFGTFAASGSDIDTFIAAYQKAAQAWEPIIHKLTLSLFWGLVTISFTWSSIQIALKGGGIVDLTADLVTRIMTVGVCVWLLDNAADLARVLLKSFQTIGTQVSGGAVKFSPGNVVELGMNIVAGSWQTITLTDPVTSLMIAIAGIIILLCFALMALEMTVLIVTAFVTVSGGIAMMGFLGSEWTREHAMNYFTAVLGIALKMFIMQLIFSLGYGFINDMVTVIAASNPATTKDIQLLQLLVMCVIFYGLMKEIPGMAVSLASGRFTHNGGGLVDAAKEVVDTMAKMAMGAGAAAMAEAAVGTAAAEMASDSVSQNDDDVMKRALDTGPENPGTPSMITAPASPDSVGASPESGGNNPGAVSAGNQKSTLSPANSTMLKKAAKKAGIKDGEQPTQEQKAMMHKILMDDLKIPITGSK